MLCAVRSPVRPRGAGRQPDDAARRRHHVVAHGAGVFFAGRPVRFFSVFFRSAYTVRQTSLPNGTVVREYVSTDGTVFGIAWRGPQMPDLSELLGGYFPQYTDGVKAARAAHGRRGVAAVDQDTLVVRSGGHMGAFAGQAWLPQALPAGVSGQDIQ